MSDGAALSEIDAYLDLAPRAASRVETIGPFTLFVGTGPWPYYARPTPRRGYPVTEAAVEAVAARQRALGQPVAFEWVQDLAPETAGACRAAGLEVTTYPLLRLSTAPLPVAAEGVQVRVVPADDEALGAGLAAVDVGFADGVMSSSRAGAQARTAFASRMITEGHLIFVVAEAGGTPVGGGSAIPRGSIAELVGIATLPEWRRRGIGAAMTYRLAKAARARGVRTLVLSAGDDDALHVYARIGFERVGSVAEASAPASQVHEP